MFKYIGTIGLIALLNLGVVYGQSWRDKLEDMKSRLEMKVHNQQREVDRKYAYVMGRVWQDADFDESVFPAGTPKPGETPIYSPKLDENWEARSFEFDLFSFETRPTAKVNTDNTDPRLPRDRNNDRDEASGELPRRPMSGYENEDFRSELSRDQLALLNKDVTNSFYGRDLPFYYANEMFYTIGKSVREEKLSQIWKQLTNSPYELMLYQMVRYGHQYQLNDWAFALMIHKTAKKIYLNDKNAQTFFTYFFLTKAGYATGICYEDNKLYLMLPTAQRIYGTTFLSGKDYKYYIFDLSYGQADVKHAKVFNYAYPESDRIFNFEFYQVPNLGDDYHTRRLEFDYEGKAYSLEVKANKNLIQFYRNYPFVDLNIPLSTPLSNEAYASVIPQLRKWMRGMDEEEGVNFLLQFVQSAFSYQSDEDQFKGENYLFAEETLFYPYSDCEDRTVLFAFLVKEILDLDVLGLIFPGHAATAVNFSRDIDGDFITWKGQKYVICDPTYIGATLGRSIPDLRKDKIKVIPF